MNKITIKLGQFKVMNLIALVIVFLINSCKPTNENEFHLLDETIVDYFGYAQDNSWWTFSDSNGNRIDSFFIKDYNVYKEIHEDYLTQFISYILCSSRFENRCWIDVADSDDSIYIFAIHTSSPSGPIEDYFGSFPSVTLSKDTFSNMYCDKCGIEKISEAASGNHIFNDVLKTWRSRDTFYFAREKGLIRLYVDDRGFLLENYKIYHDE